MRIVHVNAVSGGGAFRAMERLHRGLLAAGEDSICLLQSVDTGQNMIRGRGKFSKRLWPRLDELPLRFYPKRSSEEFNLQWVPGGILKKIRELKPDVVHLHWAHRSFFRIEDLKHIDCKIVWTMHDCWAFTGGCHYPDECERYLTGCGKCPKLGSSTEWDLSRWVWQRKIRSWKDVDITLVAPSHWLAGCARSSALTEGKRVVVIPNGLNLDSFKPLDQRVAREVLGINSHAKVVLLGALSVMDKRKGFQFLESAMAEVVRLLYPIIPELLIVGADGPEKPLNVDCPVRYIGRLYDDIALRLAYSAVDVTVVPSIQESFGQMASESLACGTPVVAFCATGLRDIVDHSINGYLAEPFNTSALGEYISLLLSNNDNIAMRNASRDKACLNFDVNAMVKNYYNIYNS